MEEQEDPVPTTESPNGEITMDPDADSPAQDASEHLGALDSSAGRNPFPDDSAIDDYSATDDNPAADNSDRDEAEAEG
ncbi:MAG: hypothetical protein HKN03_15335 [Acidimicrobiales bacterium]|nr:hypothetical protein [Acidimicrobiales bacterium]